MRNVMLKKNFVNNRNDILSSIIATINEDKPFTFTLRQFGYMDVISIGWLSTDNKTVLMADIMTQCDEDVVDGKECLFIKNMGLLAITETLPNYYKSDRRLRLKDVKAEDFIPLIIEHELRSNEKNPDNTPTYFINEKLLRN